MRVTELLSLGLAPFLCPVESLCGFKVGQLIPIHNRFEEIQRNLMSEHASTLFYCTLADKL